VVWEKPVSAAIERIDVRRVDRRGAQRPFDHGSNLIIVDSSRSARASLVKQTIAAILQEAATPLANRMLVEALLSRDGLAGQAIRTSQNDAASLRQRAGNTMATHLTLQISPLLRTQHQRRGRPAPRNCIHHQRSPLKTPSALL